jgi:glutathione synthase/RimK-type ligase-like ATP-grasp enzyme
MRIGIHNGNYGFHPYWIEYCRNRSIPYKLVNCHDNNIIEQLNNCDALMWHFSHGISIDIIMAKQLMFTLLHSGKIVFPDFYSSWHFDDKLGQKFLFESLGINHIPSYLFFDKKTALEWVHSVDFPKVFKLRGGAGSSNVKLVKTRFQAVRLVNMAFKKGFKSYNKIANFIERWRKFNDNQSDFWYVVKGLLRFIKEPNYSKTIGYQRDYIYFQDFIEGLSYDIRVVIIEDKAVALKRMTRRNDFRASGSGLIAYENEKIDKDFIRTAFQIANKLKSKSIGMDLIKDKESRIKLIEISYGFPTKNFFDLNTGYWDSELNWHEGEFDLYGWMVDSVIKERKL